MDRFLRISFLAIFLTLPMAALGQGLGSTNGLFRSPNPATKKETAAQREKKSSAPKSAIVKTNSSKTAVKPNAKITDAPRSTAKKSNKLNKTSASSAKTKSVGNAVEQPVEASVAEAYESLLEEANAARDERNYVRSEGAYRRASKLIPHDFRAVYGLGNVFSDQQRWEEAEQSYREASCLEPDSAAPFIALGFVLTQPLARPNLSDRFVEAETVARRAIKLDPANALAYDQLGVALELRGQIGMETQNAYRKAIQLDPEFALAYAHLGRLLRRKGNKDESAKAYQDSIRLAADIPTMILVADVMQSQQKYGESEQLLRRALSEDPRNPTALLMLGRALTIREIYSEAEELLKKSVEVSPASFVSYTTLGSLYARQGNFAEAEKVLLRALKVVSENERMRLAQEFEIIGDGLMKAGKAKDAVRIYRQAMQLDNQKSELIAKLAKAEQSS